MSDDPEPSHLREWWLYALVAIGFVWLVCSGVRCEVSCRSRPNPEPTWKSSGR